MLVRFKHSLIVPVRKSKIEDYPNNVNNVKNTNQEFRRGQVKANLVCPLQRLEKKKISDEHVPCKSNLIAQTVINKTYYRLKSTPATKNKYFFCGEGYPQINLKARGF